MGTRYRKMHMESVLAGKPTPWIAPPTNIVFADFSETMTNGFMAFGGTTVLTGGIQYLASNTINVNACFAWGGIALGIVVLSPIVGDVLADLASDIRQGWERGHIAEPEPEPIERIVDEPTEDEAGAARVQGTWWYKSLYGELRCYHTPTTPAKGNEIRKPIISDQRMIAIFSKVAQGVPFSERRMCNQDSGVRGLSGSQFRKLQDDWTNPSRQLYVIRPDKTGYFTQTGRLIAESIRTTKL